MAIKYYKLFDLASRKGYSKTELRELAQVASGTIAKLTKGESVSVSIINRLCEALNCQPADIMEYIPDNEK